jgi:hypothetical protein
MRRCVTFTAFAVMIVAAAVMGMTAPAPGVGRSMNPPGQFNIRPFALPATPPNEAWFEEPRDITGLIVAFDNAVPEKISVCYQRKTWPATRLEEEVKKHPAWFGWVRQDDWFNGKWQEASVGLFKLEDRRALLIFKSLKEELPETDLNGYDAAFRRTYAVRIESAGNPRIEAVYTASEPAQTALFVKLNAGSKTHAADFGVRGYNAGIVSNEAMDSEPDCRRLSIKHMKPAHDFSGDDGLVTFDFGDESFSISLASMKKEGPVWFEDMGVYIRNECDTTTFETYLERHRGLKTVNRQVTERGEQSLAGAYNGQPRPHSDNFNLGCAGAAQRFRLESNGDVVLHGRNVTWLPSMHPERWKNIGRDAARFYFGLEQWRLLGRYPDPEPVMAYNILARREGLSVTQQSFAVPLMTSIDKGDWQGGDPMVALVRFTFKNDGIAPVEAELPIQYSQDSARTGNGDNQDDHRIPRSPLDTLTLKDGRILSPFNGESCVRCEVETDMSAEARGGAVRLKRRLEPGQSCDAVLKIPYVVPEGEAELSALRRLSFDECYLKVAGYWRKVAGRGAKITTPEPQLDALYTSHLAHVLMADYEMQDGLINTSVGTSTYGNYSNESCMIVHELDLRGLHEEARKRLDLWVKYQGTAEQPGNFTDYRGMYFGADGYECGSYNQHHGWVLWCLCEHYLLTRDEAWFKRTAGSVLQAADWVFRQRKNTRTGLPHSRGWEMGFLPAGSLEDVTDFFYWLSTNALTWRGTEYAARALEAAGHPEAGRIRRESDAYKTDLLRGFEEMRRNTPLVKLNDGRWVPNYPSRLYRRGRETGWIREVLEGSVYLLISGLVDPESKQGQWILDDFQDNRYMKPPYGYSVPDFDMTWHARGGISMQPNLLAGLLPHLERDEPEIFLWMFYNAWNSCYREEINAMVEHPLPVLGWSNRVSVKTSDESNAMAWLRAMFVYQGDGSIHLGRAIPRAWFCQEKPFAATDEATEYGQVSVAYTPDPERHRAAAEVSFCRTQPVRQLLLRFRTPRGRPIHKASVNGAAGKIHDAGKGDVDLTGMTGRISVEVEY